MHKHSTIDNNFFLKTVYVHIPLGHIATENYEDSMWNYFTFPYADYSDFNLLFRLY